LYIFLIAKHVVKSEITRYVVVRAGELPSPIYTRFFFLFFFSFVNVIMTTLQIRCFCA